ncbi:MAG: class I SAM-dependent methyltransferase [Acidimicrobiia bacterium]
MGAAPRRSGGHYFDHEPAVASEPRFVELHLPDVSLRLQTDRGVFSALGVDPGTKLLLQSCAPAADETAALVDLGCGYGPIACVLASRASGATVWAVDVNRRAVELCRANAAAHGLTNVRAVGPDEVPDDLCFAGLWSNPPIRIGKGALHELLAQWLGRLEVPQGRGHLVVGKHLGSDSLARWLDESGLRTRRLSSRRGYRVLEVSPP